MIFRFRWIRYRTIGLLLLCLGLAIVGTWVVDYLIRREESRYRNTLMGQRASLNQSKVPFTPMGMTPFLFGKKIPLGTPAPDFTLPNALDQRPVHLADYRGKKPVVLMFGSFGCDFFCGQLERLNKLHQVYKDRVEFLFVYISEGPHAVLPPPTKAEEKLGHIPRGLNYFKISFPCLLGNKEIEEAYAPSPLRLLIVDRAGRIALDAGFGLGNSREWDLDRVETWLERSARIPADVRDGTSADSHQVVRLSEDTGLVLR